MLNQALMNFYERNTIYISDVEQHELKDYKILLAGCGIGSVITECAVRLGFENISIIDGDNVEMSNLNRQNYTQEDIGIKKVEAIKKRLLNINSNLNIETASTYLTESNVEQALKECKVAINALDFQSNVPFILDSVCKQNAIPILHPYNIGWGTLVFVISPNGPDLTLISDNHIGFEKEVAKYLINHTKNKSKTWIKNVLNEYEKISEKQSPPQLSIASWLAGGACTHILYRLACGKSVRYFPDYYFITIDDNAI